MANTYKKMATFAFGGVCLLVAGCSTGQPGFSQAKEGNYAAADVSFQKEYARNPNDPIVKFNMADTYMRHGERAKAISLYHDVAATGKDVKPGALLEPHYRGTTIAGAACQHLAEHGVNDPNCSI